MKWILVIGICLMAQSLMAQKILRNPIIRVQKANSLKIDSIELTDRATVLYMTISANRESGNWIQTAAPNAKNAFQMKANKRIYSLKKANNIAFSPEKNKMKKGEKRSFELYFDAIPKEIETIDLWESVDEEGINAWKFYGIQLKQPEKRDDLRTIFKNKNDFVNYYQANLRALSNKERFWILSAETIMKRGKLIDKKTLFSDIDTIASVVEFGRLYFYDMKGNRLKIKIMDSENVRFYFVLMFDERVVATKTQNFTKKPASKTKVKKSVAKVIWAEKFDKKAKYYDLISMEMLGIIL